MPDGGGVHSSRSHRRGQELAVLALALAGCAVFGALSERFLSVTNAMEIVRSSTELGLLALAMTFVIKSGGIDLSAGAILGLSAVTAGATMEAGLPWAAGGLVAVSVGAACGLANGLLVAGLRLPALVATLATMALYRGLAEGFTGGYTVFGHWPAAFLGLGQGYLAEVVPPQLLLLVAAAVLAGVALHRMPFGRRIEAIGYSMDGARAAGVPVRRCLVLAYVLSGLAAGLAGVLYAAHVGQAKADAGTGYELSAITVVVLGGTSIHGGAGTVPGTLAGLAAIAILQNGFLMAGLPSELGLVAVGGLLLLAVVGAHLSGPAGPPVRSLVGGLRMKNSQVAVLAAAVLAGALMVAGSNWLLVRSMAGPGFAAADRGGPRPGGRRLVVAVMPKSKSDPYFVSCKRGAEAAAAELDVELLWDGPTETDAVRQNEVVEAWITRGVDVIAASVENREAISTVLRKARARGIKVLTWDADAAPDARDFLVNQATAEGIGHALADEAGRILGGQGRFAIITSTLTAANQNEWMAHIKARLQAQWPELAIAVVRPSDGQRDKALTETTNVLRAYPDVRLIMAIAAPAVPGAAEAVKQAGSAAKVIGLSVPSLCRSYVHEGIIESIVLWNTVDLGYLTVHAAAQLASGRLGAGSGAITAGRLGRIEVKGDEVLLGKPFRFDRGNIDAFDF